MTYDIYQRALDILKTREEFWGEEAHKATSHVVTQCNLSTAGAYSSAWWILYYAIHKNWEALNQFDYEKTIKGEL